MYSIGNFAVQFINHWQGEEENIVFCGVLLHNCGHCVGIDVVVLGLGLAFRVAY